MNPKSNPGSRRFGALLVPVLTLALALPLRAATHNVYSGADFNTALSAAQPGDTILLHGTITSSSKFSTVRSGTSANPITITSNDNALINSTANYGIEILHDYYRLSNFRIQNPSKGIVIDNADHGIVDNVHCMDIGQEAFKVRNQSKYWEFTFCSARRTGTSGNYGEGFYVGQASSNWIGGVPDQCSYITFFNCYTIDTRNDGWDIKEGSHHVKMVNCTADFSGPIEPAKGASVGSAGFYMRADNIQVIKCRTNELNNTDWAYRISNTTVNSVDYGSTGNEIKQSNVTGGNVALIFAEGGTNARVYTDSVPGPGGLLHSGSSSVNQPAPGTFSEMTWSGVGGGTYGGLSGIVGADGDPMQQPPPTQVAAPSFNPAGGSYSSAQSVTITSATSGALIRYTVDGSTPTSTTGTLYSAPVNISVTTTLKAIAYKSGMTDSSVTSATYTISAGTVAAPSFNPVGGTYSTAQSVTITTTTSGASIRYTTDGSTPTSTTGTLYSSPVNISVTTTLKAIAYKSGMTDSTVTTATYTISGGGSPSSQDITITAGSDDAKQRDSGTVVTNSWRHPLGYDGDEQLEIGLRFPGLNVPRNATVTAAWIQFEADKTNSGTCNLTIRGEKSANAATFTTATNSITNRPTTTATVAWSPANWTQGDRGAAQKTPELKTIIQEIVNQGTWNAGNAVVFVIDGTGTRTAEAGESGAAKAPVLHVEWQ